MSLTTAAVLAALAALSLVVLDVTYDPKSCTPPPSSDGSAHYSCGG